MATRPPSADSAVLFDAVLFDTVLFDGVICHGLFTGGLFPGVDRRYMLPPGRFAVSA
ncbi:hypothetical protein ACIOGX_30010 [Streptomyces sp. NPDC088147]|uniref:hypothetical protein n=1 Tax=unclassified Streptomyces TaxID=2593676 RepID=UPI0038270D92